MTNLDRERLIETVREWDRSLPSPPCDCGANGEACPADCVCICHPKEVSTMPLIRIAKLSAEVSDELQLRLKIVADLRDSLQSAEEELAAHLAGLAAEYKLETPVYTDESGNYLIEWGRPEF